MEYPVYAERFNLCHAALRQYAERPAGNPARSACGKRQPTPEGSALNMIEARMCGIFAVAQFITLVAAFSPMNTAPLRRVESSAAASRRLLPGSM